MREEEIKVVEDSRHMVIRTEAVDDGSAAPARSLMRKFRLPVNVDVDGISARYEAGVLTVTVPRTSLRCSRGFFIDPADLPERLEILARAA